MLPAFAVLAESGRGIRLEGAPTLLSLCALLMLREGILSARGGLEDAADDDEDDDVTV